MSPTSYRRDAKPSIIGSYLEKPTTVVLLMLFLYNKQPSLRVRFRLSDTSQDVSIPALERLL